MAVGVGGFMLGSSLGFLLATDSFPFMVDEWRIHAVLGWLAGGIVGLTGVVWAWNDRFPSTDPDEVPEFVIPDQFNQGPDLSGRDAFGDPRF
jgi:hypothetical protein